MDNLVDIIHKRFGYNCEFSVSQLYLYSHFDRRDDLISSLNELVRVGTLDLNNGLYSLRRPISQCGVLAIIILILAVWGIALKIGGFLL